MLTPEEREIQQKFKQAMTMDKPITRRALSERLQKLRGYELLTQQEKTNVIDEVLKTPTPRKYLFGNKSEKVTRNIANYIFHQINWTESKQGRNYWLHIYCRVRDTLAQIDCKAN